MPSPLAPLLTVDDCLRPEYVSFSLNAKNSVHSHYRDDSYRGIAFMNIHDVKPIALITLICIAEYKESISRNDN